MDTAIEAPEKSTSGKENYAVMFKFRLALLIAIDQPGPCLHIKTKNGEIDSLTNACLPPHPSAGLRLLVCLVVSELIRLLSLASADQIKNPSDQHGVTIGGTHCHHGPMGSELKRVTGNFCIFCRLDHSTGLWFGFAGP